ncbi:hypothetical protein MZO42_07430 [Sphingomonas psychrotolerans]|uniref:DUF2306 domain-containing protein n=1 Tax=Sphingomonas psychrotolerans TaxID=1327635 RepID=A0ABU3N5C7_9SPHN|nr:hypothetical protein [Sphingomonas psychrotolerans]MDT8758525.1 hypothetical protein [Sphingomonas psychrotolerans]
MATLAAVPMRKRGNPDRLFFGSAAIALLLVTLIGFAPTYYFSYFTTAPALTPLVHLHGVVFSGWMLFYAGQTWLIGAGNSRLHRRVGMAGAALAVLVFVVGVVTTITLARANLHAAVRHGAPPIFPLGAITAFAVLCTAGIVLRQRPMHHKRLMLLATVALATTPLARITRMVTDAVTPPVGGIILSDLFLLALIAFDLRQRGRLHPATLAGGGFLIASQLFRIGFGQTALWRSFLHVVVG